MAGWRVWIGLWAGVGLMLLDVADFGASPPSIEPTADAKLFDDQFRPLVVLYRIGCHGGDKPNGNLRPDNVTTDFADAATRAHWTTVTQRLKPGEMPPKGKR
jgi:Planctomycete cytochrome C